MDGGSAPKPPTSVAARTDPQMGVDARLRRPAKCQLAERRGVGVRASPNPDQSLGRGGRNELDHLVNPALPCCQCSHQRPREAPSNTEPGAAPGADYCYGAASAVPAWRLTGDSVPSPLELLHGRCVRVTRGSLRPQIRALEPPGEPLAGNRSPKNTYTSFRRGTFSLSGLGAQLLVAWLTSGGFTRTEVAAIR